MGLSNGQPAFFGQFKKMEEQEKGRAQRYKKVNKRFDDDIEPLYRVGQLVFGKFQGGTQYFPCVIVKVKDLTYTCVYTDGMSDQRPQSSIVLDVEDKNLLGKAQSHDDPQCSKP
jgi:hypothetical protein